jgi:hypothetical protein
MTDLTTADYTEYAHNLRVAGQTVTADVIDALVEACASVFEGHEFSPRARELAAEVREQARRNLARFEDPVVLGVRSRVEGPIGA